jgi:hypothetical protein
MMSEVSDHLPGIDLQLSIVHDSRPKPGYSALALAIGLKSRSSDGKGMEGFKHGR